ncbi:uncharacterized protein IL334_007460 [Kwoniella shivajii]|uniref:Prephenate dehydratase domain-containing protein n=1 Tax=Kwoniella shivajii TaxID=564305 RepID=A0ABZ1D8Q4_9TREE|nr:hypothetical protein IL334_007460 [Kwoniella shivajii]
MTDDHAISRNGGSPTKQAKLNSGKDDRLTMAYLGPPGTYGEMAAAAFKSCYNVDIDLVPCPSISAIWERTANFHVLPLENTIHGGVTETLDCLLSNLNPFTEDESSIEKVKRKRRIVADLALPISHCLVVRKGTRKEDIRWIRSHEQALGQSSKYLKTQYPGVKLKTWPSTAGAAVTLLSPSDEDLAEGPGAALCAKAAAKLYQNELDILFEGTQGISDNYTRFILLSDSKTSSTHTPSSIPNPNPTEFYILPAASDIIPFLQSSQIRNIHTRPTPTSSSAQQTEEVNSSGEVWKYREERFPTLYFIEVDQQSIKGDVAVKRNEEGENKEWALGKASWRVTDTQLKAI